MAKSLQELQRERGQLLERIVHQRRALALELAPLGAAQQAGERMLGVFHTLMRHVRENPVPVAAAVAALWIWRPRGVMRWARRGLWLWRRWESLGPIVRALAATARQ